MQAYRPSASPIDFVNLVFTHLIISIYAIHPYTHVMAYNNVYFKFSGPAM